MSIFRKVLAVSAALVCVALCSAGPGDKTNSLFLSSDRFSSSEQHGNDVPVLQVEGGGDGSKKEFTLSSDSPWDSSILSVRNCSIVLGIAAALGVGCVLRDKLFAHYR
jgi:hypothetical protein